MSDLRTAAQQALEALEEWLYATTDESEFLAYKAITTLRSALAEPVQEPVARRERLNPPPHVLSDALQDRVHITLDKGRAVKTLRIKPGCMGEEK